MISTKYDIKPYARQTNDMVRTTIGLSKDRELINGKVHIVYIICQLFHCGMSITHYIKSYYRISILVVVIPLVMPIVSISTEEDDAIFEQLETML